MARVPANPRVSVKALYQLFQWHRPTSPRRSLEYPNPVAASGSRAAWAVTAWAVTTGASPQERHHPDGGRGNGRRKGCEPRFRKETPVPMAGKKENSRSLSRRLARRNLTGPIMANSARAEGMEAICFSLSSASTPFTRHATSTSTWPPPAIPGRNPCHPRGRAAAGMSSVMTHYMPCKIEQLDRRGRRDHPYLIEAGGASW
jgi:hypothetical protein